MTGISMVDSGVPITSTKPPSRRLKGARMMMTGLSER